MECSVGLPALARLLACSWPLPLSLAFFLPPFLLFLLLLLPHLLLLLVMPLYSTPRMSECRRRERKRERVKKQMGGKTANKNKTIALQNKQKQKERASLHIAKQRSGRMQKDHQREQREKGIQRFGNAVEKAGKTASRIESVFFQIFSTNQRSVVVAQSI